MPWFVAFYWVFSFFFLASWKFHPISPTRSSPAQLLPSWLWRNQHWTWKRLVYCFIKCFAIDCNVPIFSNRVDLVVPSFLFSLKFYWENYFNQSSRRTRRPLVCFFFCSCRCCVCPFLFCLFVCLFVFTEFFSLRFVGKLTSLLPRVSPRPPSRIHSFSFDLIGHGVLPGWSTCWPFFFFLFFLLKKNISFLFLWNVSCHFLMLRIRLFVFFFAFSMETTFFFLPSRHRNFELYQVMSLVLVFT